MRKVPSVAEELLGTKWLLLGRRNVRGLRGMAPVLRQKLEETAEATADTNASYASLMGKADDPVLASEDMEVLESCSIPETGRG